MSAISETEGWTMRLSRTFDFLSKINGVAYRLSVATPLAPPPPEGYPVLIVLDGNANFGTASETARGQSMFSDAVNGALVAGLGYQAGDLSELLRLRYRDLTTKAPPEEMGPQDPYAGAVSGGMDAFLEVLSQEVRAIIQARFPVDQNQMALFGHSLGGLTTLRAMLTGPERFQSYIASSPSLHWNARAVFGEVEGFKTRLAGQARPPRLLMTVASDEDDVYPMAVNVRAMADRLEALNAGGEIEMKTHLFQGENHDSVVPGALSRAVRFAFAKDP